MTTKQKSRKQKKSQLSRRMRYVVLPLFFVFAAGVLILVVLSFGLIPKSESRAQYGVGADGFRAFVEDKGDLGASALVTKQEAVTALGDKAKSVANGSVSKVFNLNGDRSQTVTFPFVRTDDVAASVYIDMKLYKNSRSIEADNLYVATAKAGTINGYPAYFKHAQTIDGNREYHMLVVNGLRVYRFVLTQPFSNITISELSSMAILKRLAESAKL